MRRYNFRPGGAARKMSRIACIPFTIMAGFFVYIGVTRLGHHAGAFGILWIAMAVIFFCVGLYGLISKDGLWRGYDIEVEESEALPEKQKPAGAAARLEELEDMYRRGLVTQAEYDAKREEILQSL